MKKQAVLRHPKMHTSSLAMEFKQKEIFGMSDMEFKL